MPQELPKGATIRSNLPQGAVIRGSKSNLPEGAVIRDPAAPQAPQAPQAPTAEDYGGLGMEAVGSVVRAGSFFADIATSPLQALGQALDLDIPSFRSLAAEKGDFSGGGLATDTIDAAVQLGTSAVPAGAGMRLMSAAVIEATRLGPGFLKTVLTSLGQTTAKQDALMGAVSGVLGEGTGEVAAEQFGEEYRDEGRLVGQFITPASWKKSADLIGESVRDVSPSPAHLKGAAQSLYSLLEEAGIRANPASVLRMKGKVNKFIDLHSLDSTTKSGALRTRMLKVQKKISKGKVSYNYLQKVSSGLKADAGQATDQNAIAYNQAADMIDDVILKMVPADTTLFTAGADGVLRRSTIQGGDKLADLGGRQVREVLHEANDLWRRGRMTETLEKIQNKAQKDSVELRTGFSTASYIRRHREGLNKLTTEGSSNYKYLKKHEREAIEKATGRGTLQALMEAGQFGTGINSSDMTKSVVLSAVVGTAAYAGGVPWATYALVGGLAISKVAGESANYIFKRNINAVKGNLAAGNNAQKIINNYNRYTQPNKRNREDLTRLLIKNDADLEALPAKQDRIPWMADSVWMASVAQEIIRDGQEKEAEFQEASQQMPQ